MIDRITAGAASLMGSLVVGTLAVRWAVSPTPERGRHQAPRVRQVLDEASLDELLGPWPQPAYGAVVVQAWRDCPTCAQTTAGVVQRNGWWCGQCLTPSGGAS